MPGRSGEGNQVEKWEGWGRKSSQWQLYTPLEINANYDAKVTTEQISENQWKKGGRGKGIIWPQCYYRYLCHNALTLPTGTETDANHDTGMTNQWSEEEWK